MERSSIWLVCIKWWEMSSKTFSIRERRYCSFIRNPFRVTLFGDTTRVDTARELITWRPTRLEQAFEVGDKVKVKHGVRGQR